MGGGASSFRTKQAAAEKSNKASDESQRVPEDKAASKSTTPPSRSPSSPEGLAEGSAGSHKTRIVCGWAGIGKSYLAQAPDFRALDLDSAKYSWIKDAAGNNMKKRNPNAEIDYPAAIINEFRSQKHDFLLVSTHEYVRVALQKEKIPYTIVYPSLDRKDEFQQRYIDRKNDEGMIKFLIDGWETLLGDLQADTNPFATHLEMAESGSFLDAYAQQLR